MIRLTDQLTERMMPWHYSGAILFFFFPIIFLTLVLRGWHVALHLIGRRSGGWSAAHLLGGCAAKRFGTHDPKGWLRE